MYCSGSVAMVMVLSGFLCRMNTAMYRVRSSTAVIIIK